MGDADEKATVLSMVEWKQVEDQYSALLHRLADDLEHGVTTWSRASADLGLRGPFKKRFVEAVQGEPITISNEELASCGDECVVAMQELLGHMRHVLAVLRASEGES